MRSIFISILILIIIVGFNIEILEEAPQEVPIEVLELENLITPQFFYDEHPSIDSVFEACLYYEIVFPEIVVAQAILESGHFTSSLCKNNNNILGLYNSNSKTFFKFNHWTDSIKGYKTMVAYKFNINNPNQQDYYKFLQELPYAMDPNYIPILKQIVTKTEVVLKQGPLNRSQIY